ncbi:MAG: branched-chain amino acid ABC transporter permease [Armatimonadetes bacterium]|nr:branched-chain amino acid ABC transporter permease [Armatimonadota bacterium]
MAAADARPQAVHSGSIWRWLLAVTLALALAEPLVTGHTSGYAQRIIILAGINIVLAVSLNLVNGITGQFSIGHAGFMAIGAYVSAAITVFGGLALEQWAASGHLDPARPVLNLFLVGQPGLGVQLRAQVWFAFALLSGGAAAALAGVLVGLPTLRLRGDYLAIATLGFGEIVRVILLNLDVVGGASGFTGTQPFNKLPSYTNFFNTYLCAAVTVFAITALGRSTRGRALVAIRDDEVAAEAVGIDTIRFKVGAFALSAFFAGVAGGLLAHYLSVIIPTPTMFGFMRSIEIIAMVVLGGTGSTTGAVLAAIVLTVLPERLRDLDQWRMVLYAEVLIVMMLVRRQGLLGRAELTDASWRRLGEWLRGGRRGGGLKRTLGTWRDALRQRFFVVGMAPLTGWVALGLWCLPILDLLIFLPALGEMLTRALNAKPAAWLAYAGLPPRMFAADVVSALTSLVPAGLKAVPIFAALAPQIKLPLEANPGLSLAVLPLALPWAALCTRLARGDKRALLWLGGLLLLATWHALGNLAGGMHGGRVLVETVVALLALAGLATQLGARRRLPAGEEAR